jgi:hypothetical protein
MSKDLQLVPLFGDKNDMRSKLFIDQLRDSADAVRAGGSYVPVSYTFAGTVVNKFGNVQFTNVTKGFQNRFYAKSTPGRGDMDAHDEVDEYICDLHARLCDSSKNGKPLSPEAVDVIKKFAGAAAIGSEQEFAQAVIKALVRNLSGSAGVDIKLATTWSGVTGGNYNDSNMLAWNLIEPTIDVMALKLLPSGIKGVVSTSTATIVSPGAPIATSSGSSIAPLTTFNLNMIPSGQKISPVDNLHQLLRNGCGKSASGKKEFTYRYDKYWLKTMLESHATTASTSVAPSKFFDDVVPTSVEEYVRKGTELYKRDATGKETRVDLGSDLAKALSVDTKCMGTGFVQDSTKPNESCADYLRECLSGNDVTKCKEYLADEKFWDNAVNEVDNMLPAMAIKTLNAFEFGMEQVWDTVANRRLLKYKSTTTWLEGLTEIAKAGKRGMTMPEVQNIAKNVKLIGYLNMVVKKVNSSPAILNKDYIGKTSSNQLNDPDAFTGSRLHKMGVRARLATNNLSVSSVDKLSQAIKDSNSRVSVTLGLPGVYGFASKFSLSGGSNTMEALEEKVSDETKQTAYIIEAHFVSLNTRLKKHGKEISKEDATKILNLLDSLKKSEDKLNKAMLYTEKYTRLLEVHGQKDNTDILSMDHLKQFVDNRNKYFARVSKKQNDLMSIIRSIAEAVNKETPSADAEMKAIDVDAKSVNINALLG